MALSPRKVVPLTTGDDCNPRKGSLSGAGITKRVFFCGVVVEGSENGRKLREDVQDLVLSLGAPLSSSPASDILSQGFNTCFIDRSKIEHPLQGMRPMTDSSALGDVISELLSTERSYVKRLRTLKYDYADPLRRFSRNKETAILPPYEAKTLFGNIDNLLPVNEAFLADLERLVSPDGGKRLGGIGDVALKHFKISQGFEHYKQYYVKREEAQTIFEREMVKKASGFAEFVDRIKYSSADNKNRVGLRELLINPVQRVPQYTLLFRTMMKHMSSKDPQRAKLVEAEDIASKIAMAETDEKTKRAAIMYCLTATIDDFPPALISSSRRFIDCIDVEDVVVDPSMSSTASGSGPLTPASLHCTLFLFDDKLMIVKRPGNGEKSGRALTGLQDLDKLTRAGGLPLGMKKSGMVCKGVVDVADVVAADVGGPDIHLYLESPPEDQGDRWSGRPFRSLSVTSLDPVRAESDKKQFLENLWEVQAMFRAKAGQSVVLCAEDREVESKAGKITLARTYFNVYQRTAFLQENKKTKILVHIDASGSADPIPFGINAPPFVVVRVQPMAGELSRYSVASSDPNDEEEEDIVQTARVPSRIVQTIHQFGLFKFRTDNNSVPSTPTASSRSRAAIFGLDALSRNLFNARPGSAMGELFGGSATHKRSKSTLSKSSIYTQTTSTGDGSLTKFSRRSNSTATAATSVSATEDDSISVPRTAPRPRKLLKRGKSPSGSGTELDRTSQQRSAPLESTSAPSSRSQSKEPVSSDDEEGGDSAFRGMGMDQSEWDLTMRLELARKNSNQQGKQPAAVGFDQPVEEIIYEEPPIMQPPSRASGDTAHRETPSQSESTIPIKGSDSSPRHSRSSSQQASERRPFGPRSPSPLPPKSPIMPPTSELSPMDVDLASETNVIRIAPGISSQTRAIHSPLPRSKRQPFLPTGNTETTPKPPAGGVSGTPSNIEPLSIKKKISVRSSGSGTPTPARKSYSRGSPLSRKAGKVTSPRRSSHQGPGGRVTTTLDNPTKTDIAERVMQSAQSSRSDFESSHFAVKRIKLEMTKTWSNTLQTDADGHRRQTSSDKGTRTSQGLAPTTKAAQERMEEMRQLIGMRQCENIPQNRPRSVAVPNSSGPRVMDSVGADASAHSAEELLSDAERDLTRAITNYDAWQADLLQLTADFKERSEDLERARLELKNAKRQCELVKSLLADAAAEKDIMYEAFNEELDGMYNDANLPEDEAWVAMSTDLRQTKAARNTLTKENSELMRRMAEMESQKEEWRALLQAHGLIP